MNTFAIVAVLALLAYTASATPCTEIYSAQCTIKTETCKAAKVFGDFCDAQSGLCAQECAAACGCADGCAAQCGQEYATCAGDGSNQLNVLICGSNLPACAENCQLTCNFNMLAAIINAGAPGALGR